MSGRSPKPPPGYREAYATLSRVAAELEDGEVDLDRVLPLIEEAKAAYALCRSRIEAVRVALGGLSGPEQEGLPDEDASPADDEDEPDDEL